MENKQTIGDGYKKLMSLYNQKRADAARAGDDQRGIDYYMGKMDEMRQIAKQVKRSKETNKKIRWQIKDVYNIEKK